ncbi:MAG: tyrosine-type recombinase/integrase [Eubacteriaceae bacterium]
MRRANNTGSVYKMPGKRRNPYIARVCTGYDETGYRKWMTIGYFKNKTEAEKAIARHEIMPVSDKANIKLSELFEEWKVISYKNLSKKSVSMYNTAYGHLGLLHNKKFAELRTIHFQKIIDDLPLGRSSTNKIKILVNQLYDYAYSQDIVNKNYSKAIRLEREVRSEIPTFTIEQIKLLIENDTLPYADSVLILIFAGFRPNEMLMLTKDRIHLDEGVMISGIKTEAGIDRVVPIHPQIYKYIKNRYDNANHFLFEHNGNKMNDKIYREQFFKPLMEQLGIKGMLPKYARHTFATLSAKFKLQDIAIQQIMGHTDYAFTANRYTHRDLELLRNEIRKISII